MKLDEWRRGAVPPLSVEVFRPRLTWIERLALWLGNVFLGEAVLVIGESEPAACGHPRETYRLKVDGLACQLREKDDELCAACALAALEQSFRQAFEFCIPCAVSGQVIAPGDLISPVLLGTVEAPIDWPVVQWGNGFAIASASAACAVGGRWDGHAVSRLEEGDLARLWQDGDKIN
jgi:hypothetical protein